MSLPAVRQTRWVVLLCSIGLSVDLLRLGADEPALLELVGDRGLAAWRQPTGDWLVAADSVPDPARTNRLTAKPGQGTLINGVTGKTLNLLTSEDFGDIDAHFEFLIFLDHPFYFGPGRPGRPTDIDRNFGELTDLDGTLGHQSRSAIADRKRVSVLDNILALGSGPLDGGCKANV